MPEPTPYWKKHQIGDQASEYNKVIAKFHITIVELDDGRKMPRFEIERGSGYMHYSDIIKLLQNCIDIQNKLSDGVLDDTTFSSKI